MPALTPLAPDVVALSPCATATVLWLQGNRLRATVVVKATFGLLHGSPARMIAPRAIATKDRHAGGRPTRSLVEASELSPHLPTAGVLLYGRARAPAGRPVPAMSVRLALFSDRPLLDKTLHVFGERGPGAPPAPFTEMPIVYEKAFGGPGVEDNPIGVGADGDSASLPSILDPRDPRRPAGFGPIPSFWPARKRLLGGASVGVLRQEVVDIREGFDWRFYHGAPADQQLGFLRGDEWIVLDGMHPEHSRLEARLPGARALARVSLPGQRAQPLALRADTLVLETDSQVGHVVWRGTFDLERVTREPSTVHVGIELPGHPVVWPIEAPVSASGPAKGARAVDLGASSTELLDLLVPADPEPLDEETLARTLNMDRAGHSARQVAPFEVASPGERAGGEREIPGAPWPRGGGLDAAPTPEPDDDPLGHTTLHFVRSSKGPSLPSDQAGAPRPAESPDGAESETQPFVAMASSRSPAAVMEISDPETMALSLITGGPEPAQPPPVGPTPKALRELVVARLASGEALDELDLAGADLGGLDLSGRLLSGCVLTGAVLVRTILRDAQLGGARMTGADLTEADLTGADLERADLAWATLDGAKLDGARLGDADLTSARGVKLSARRVDAPRVRLARGTWRGSSFAGARLAGADLSGASLDGARFEGCDLTGARLEGAHGESVELDGANLSAVRASGASFARSSLVEIEAADSVWENARLEGAKLDGARLHRASLRGAVLRGASLEGADLRDADLAGANLQGVDLDRAKLAGANLKNALRSGAAGGSEG